MFLEQESPLNLSIVVKEFETLLLLLKYLCKYRLNKISGYFLFRYNEFFEILYCIVYFCFFMVF